MTLADVTEVTAPYTDTSGPADREPRGPVTPEPDRAAFLVAALDGVDLGAYDRRIIAWLARLDDPTCRTVVAWLVRARRAGFEEGRAAAHTMSSTEMQRKGDPRTT